MFYEVETEPRVHETGLGDGSGRVCDSQVPKLVGSIILECKFVICFTE